MMNDEMNLIIFDIDGTLTQTNDVDSICFAKAIKDMLQINDLNTDWASYQYSTDSGLLNEIYTHFLQRLPSSEEIDLIKTRFVDYLKQAWQEDKACYAPVPGAISLFEQILALSHWHAALATGGWKESALFKLSSAEIPHQSLPKAYADDHVERTEIIKVAIKQARSLHQVEKYQRIIYVGDKAWDERAANLLQIEFIGVGQEFNQRKDAQQLFIETYEPSAPLLNFLQ